MWGGREDCEHEWREQIKPAGNGLVNNVMQGETLSGNSATRKPTTSASCLHCSAWLGVFGLEPTPEMYVQHIVEIFRELKRVLRKDGTCWVNLGDTLKCKDLCMIPARVALALQADGWWIRSEIIWAKPNPMPESVTDRPTTAHEKIFLLTKSARYFYDAEAVREASQEIANNEREIVYSGGPRCGFASVKPDGGSDIFNRRYINPNGRNLRSVWTIATQPFFDAHFATFPEEIAARCIKAGTSGKGVCANCGAPWVRVLEKSPHDSTGAYGSNAPGTGSRMFIDRDPQHDRPKTRKNVIPQGNYGGKWAKTDPQSSARRILANTKAGRDAGLDHDNPFISAKTLGWKPSCTCRTEEIKPAVVLDPFCGAGTTPLVADKLGRIGIGLELKREYVSMAKSRCFNDAPLLSISQGGTHDEKRESGKSE